MTIFDIIKSGDYLILDTETTGLDASAEICQIAIIDSSGKVLLDTLVKPVRPIPPEATAIHGITNEMVSMANEFPATVIHELVYGRNVVIYNSEYDVSMLYKSESARAFKYPYKWWEIATWHCAMEAFAEIYGDWNDYHQSYRWQKLSTACVYYKIPQTKAHGALEDCLSTLAVCKAMLAEHIADEERLAEGDPAWDDPA